MSEVDSSVICVNKCQEDSDGNKDTSVKIKAKVKDLISEAKTEAKDLPVKAKYVIYPRLQVTRQRTYTVKSKSLLDWTVAKDC